MVILWHIISMTEPSKTVIVCGLTLKVRFITTALALAHAISFTKALWSIVTFYAKLDRKETNDGLEEAFNTPQWILNVGLSNRNLGNGWGMALNYKWQDAFVWQSSLATGTVPAYSTLDGQVSYELKSQPIELKLGATNLLNQYYYNFLAGPSVGGFYYLSATLKL
jgi:outer membrane receptor protein involved in Fe transport